MSNNVENELEPNRYRDKRDLRVLPPIPAELANGFQELLGAKIGRGGLTYIERLEAVYGFMDRFNAFVATFAVCRKGCNQCCRIDVLVGRLEAEYIATKGGIGLDVGWERTAGNRSACPFIGIDGGCSVYDSRPFNCRTFHTLDDPKYCVNPAEEHQVYGSASSGYGVTIYRTLADWLKDAHESNGLLYRDIRDWFPPGTVDQR